jgi:hypothetical protein
MRIKSYIRTFYNDIFGKEPDEKVLSDYEDILSESIDSAEGSILQDELFDKLVNKPEWKKDFENYALKNFATKLVGASAIRLQDFGILKNPDIVKDLKEEFYQTLLNSYLIVNLSSLLLSNNVMVSKNTAKLYNVDCMPSENQWKLCPLPPERKSFFSTYGFLASSQSSFLDVNNNYGRIARLYYIINGQVFKASTDSDTGGIVDPLPDCLKTQDFRGVKNGENIAPFGTAKIPLTGNICQSCHIDKHLAAGSILFRQFYRQGQIITPEAILKTNLFSDDSSLNERLETDLNNAQKPEILNYNTDEDEPKKVDNTFLRKLLSTNSGSESACIKSNDSTSSYEEVKDLKEFAEELIGPKGENFAVGLAYHIPKAISNLPNTNVEIISRFKTVWQKSDGKLLELLRSYLTSKTYSCEKVY